LKVEVERLKVGVERSLK